jgi:hypothetical protein
MKISTIVRWVIAITVALLVCERVLSQKAGGRTDRARVRARQFDRPSSKRPQISYSAAVFAIAHCLPEVGVSLEGRKRRELISRVLSVPLAGREEPYGSADVWIDYEVTVSAFARELEEQRAVTRMPYREVAERALRLPLEQSLSARRASVR